MWSMWHVWERGEMNMYKALVGKPEEITWKN
jgi:hypothetical protein